MFQPFVPTGGLAGWRFLQSTIDAQKAAHAEDPVAARDLAYFRENIGAVRTAADLVSDYRLLSTALRAFGLGDDINSKALIRQVLEGGTVAPDSLANRLADKRYRDFSSAFGFGDFPIPNTALSDFPDRIERRFRDLKFEEDIGQTSETMRLALNAERELTTIGAGSGSNRTKWFTIMGTPPLRKVMEGALGLPTSFATLPIDRQLETFQERAKDQFGTSDVAELSAPDTMGRLLDRYTAIAGLTEAPGISASSPALVLLRGF